MDYIIRSADDKARLWAEFDSLDMGEWWVVSIEPIEPQKRPQRGPGIPGMSKNPLYAVWNNMWERCTNPKHVNFKHYGGRGISVSDEWRDFVQFLINVGERPGPGYSLDRVDVNGNYCRENVRWATRKEQARNKRNTKTVEWRGEKRPLLEWAEITGIPYPVLQLRLDRRKWTPQQAFTTPVTSPGWQKGMKRGSRIGG